MSIHRICYALGWTYHLEFQILKGILQRWAELSPNGAWPTRRGGTAWERGRGLVNICLLSSLEGTAGRKCERGEREERAGARAVQKAAAALYGWSHWRPHQRKGKSEGVHTHCSGGPQSEQGRKGGRESLELRAADQDKGPASLSGLPGEAGSPFSPCNVPPPVARCSGPEEEEEQRRRRQQQQQRQQQRQSLEEAAAARLLLQQRPRTGY